MVAQYQGDVTLWVSKIEIKKDNFFKITFLFGDFFFPILCEYNMYIVQKKTCSNVMTNKQKRRTAFV